MLAMIVEHARTHGVEGYFSDMPRWGMVDATVRATDKAWSFPRQLYIYVFPVPALLGSFKLLWYPSLFLVPMYVQYVLPS